MRLPSALLLGPLALCLPLPNRAAAHPYAALRPSDSVLAGPMDGGVESLAYNPAALRLQHGYQLQVQTSVQGFVGSYQRLSPLPAGFSPGSAAAPAPETAFRWAVPGYFIGGSWDLGTETVSIGAALYLPYADGTRYGDGDDPEALARLTTRYHAIASDAYSLWGSLGAGLRITSWLYLGGGFNFSWTRARRDYLRDPDLVQDGLGCGDAASCEQWSRRQRLRLDVGGWGFGFSAGALLIPLENRLWLAASFTSALFTTGQNGGDQVPLSGQPLEGDPCPEGGLPGFRGAELTAAGRSCYGGAELVYSFPYLTYLGARLRLSPKEGPRRPRQVELTAWGRLAIPSHRDQQLRLERRAFLTEGTTFELPASSYLPGGEQTAFAVELGVRQLWSRLHLGQALLYESPRAATSAVTPANLAGHRFDLSGSARLSLHQRLWLLLTAGVTFYYIPDGAGERIDPALSTACRAAAYDALSFACREAQDGWARPPAAGRYQLTVPHGAAALEVRL